MVEMQKSITRVTHFTLTVVCTLPAPMVPLARYRFVATSGYVFDQSWGGMHLDSINGALAVMAKEHSNSGYSF